MKAVPTEVSGLAGSTAIVLGADGSIAVNIIRELGAAGVRVVAIAVSADALGVASRHVRQSWLVDRLRSEQTLHRIREVAAGCQRCSVLTVSEPDLFWLIEHSHELGAARAAVPSREAMLAVLDKSVALQHAQEVGLRTPVTEQLKAADELPSLARRFPFPAVLKWADPQTAADALRTAGLVLHKYQYVYSPEEFLDVMCAYAPVGRWPLVQEYCPGTGLGLFFFMHKGQAVRRFVHRRVAEWPPEGGYSSVCEALPREAHGELQDKAIALLQRLGWEGVAMVEFRWDAERQQAVFMEVNGRFWGSFALAVQAGAGFALLSHARALGGPLPALPPPAVGVRCRMISTEIKRLIRIGFAAHLIQDRNFPVRPWAELGRFGLDYLRPGTGYFLWSWRDPGPWLRDAGLVARKAWRRLLRR